jgi:hypothetical protein
VTEWRIPSFFQAGSIQLRRVKGAQSSGDRIAMVTLVEKLLEQGAAPVLTMQCELFSCCKVYAN